MKTCFSLLIAFLLAIVAAGCGPTVRDYSDALQGSWTTPIEDFSDDGTIERGTVVLTFAPIPEGSESSHLSVSYRGHVDASSSYGYTFDLTVSVKGTYTIDDTEDEYPLDMRWDVSSLKVEVSDVKMSDFTQDFQASLEELTAEFLGVRGGSRLAVKNQLTKNMKSLCRQALIEKNNDKGCYGLELDGDSFFLILADGSYKFTRSTQKENN